MATRKLLPLAGHKHEMTKMCFRTYCECGWSSCAHWERAQAYGEWREHIQSHGGEYEPWEKAWAREDRAKRKAVATLLDGATDAR
jgi:hypothetical protein